MTIKPFITLSLIALGFTFASCTSNSDTTKKSEVKEETAVVEEETAIENPAIKTYLDLKDNLVNTDAASAKEGAIRFQQAISDMSGDGIDEMLRASELIANTDDIEEQREHFETISNAMYAYAKDHDMGIKLYWQHCPMAFNDRGASWLSDERKIMNPYFGDKMLNCGKVEAEI